MSSPRRSSHLRLSAASLFVRLPPDYAGHAARKHLLCSKRHSHPQISKHPSPSCASRSCGLKILLFYHRSQRSMDGLDHELCRMTRVSPQGFNSHLPLRLKCRRCMQRQTGVRIPSYSIPKSRVGTLTRPDTERDPYSSSLCGSAWGKQRSQKTEESGCTNLWDKIRFSIMHEDPRHPPC